MDELERIEEHRDRVAGLEYEGSLRVVDLEEYERDAYELDDPKHPDHHDVYADWSDLE